LKRQIAAREILKRLVSHELLPSKAAAEIRAIVDLDDSSQAFQLCRKWIEPTPVGWNKFWEGGTLYGWFGDFVSAEPLRLVALEITSDSISADEIRRDLFERWEGKDPGPLSHQATRILAELAVTVAKGKLAKTDLNLLRRLNLDQRDQPFIERWRWSGGSGYATLSDEGRFQIKPALVWSRGIEAALDEGGQIPLNVAEALLAADPEADFLALPHCAASEKFIERLIFFGSGKRWVGGVSLASPLGTIPRELARLF